MLQPKLSILLFYYILWLTSEIMKFSVNDFTIMIIFRHKRYRSFDQQDSHEAFRYLLDALKMEEIKVSSRKCFQRPGVDPVPSKI